VHHVDGQNADPLAFQLFRDQLGERTVQLELSQPLLDGDLPLACGADQDGAFRGFDQLARTGAQALAAADESDETVVSSRARMYMHRDYM
jgi:hypothetical protein